MIKTLLRSFFLLLILIIGFITFLLTPMGLKFSINIASKFLPGQLSYQKISGVIIGPITIDQLHYKTREQNIFIKKLRINWHPIDLLKHQLHINTINVHDVTIIATKNPIPIQWNQQTIQLVINDFVAAVKNKILPLHLLIDDANFTQIQFINPNTKLSVKKIFFHAILTKSKWDATFVAIINKPKPYKVQFSVEGKPTNYTMHFSIQGQQIHWKCIGNGNQQSLEMHTLKNIFL